MYKSNYKRVLSAVLVVVMLLGMLPVTSFSAATGAIGQAELLSAIPDLDFVIEENSLELVEIVAFEEDFAPGYGSNGKFLAPIGAPDDDSLPISTRAQLEAIGNDATSLGGKYHLINDIDLGGSGWAPIGSYNTSFTGTFDGQGYVIRNLTIAGNIYQYAGLFGYANIGTIRNVGLEDTHINDSYTPSFGRPHAGGICGIIVGSSSIFNCYNTGYVSTSDFAGGICGSISDNASISNCYNLGDIYSYSSSSSTACMAGGICGTSAGAISNSYNTGGVSVAITNPNSYAGGICGYNTGLGSINNCYSTGDISAISSNSAHAGGICGYNNGTDHEFINNCITLSKRIYAEAPYTYSYLISHGGRGSNNLALKEDVEGDPYDDSDRRISPDEAKDQITYEEELEWDFEDVWQMVDGYAYPQLRGLPPAGLSTDATLASLSILDVDESMLFPEFGINVTSHHVTVPYGIDKVIIAAKANHPGASISGIGEQKLSEVGEYSFEVKVTAEDGDTVKIYTITITRLEEIPIDPSKFLAPIELPDPSAKKIYTAQQLHNVRNDLSGSYILMNDIDLADWGEWGPIGDNLTDDDSSRFIGIFDGQGCVIKNLSIAGDTYQYSGLFGYINNAEIKNVGLESTDINAPYSSSDADSYAGSICGYTTSDSNTISISNCYNTGDISSADYAGGICAYSDVPISICYNTGDISTNSQYAGGICGIGANLMISYCYNTGEISSPFVAGGICGGGSGSISDCYNTGDLFFSYWAGGICGVPFFDISITNCYNTGDISPYAYAGGICGLIFNGNAIIIDCYNEGDIFTSSYVGGGICGYINGSIANCAVVSKQIYPTGFDGIGYLISLGGTKTSNLVLEGISGDHIDDSNGRITQEQAEDQFTYETGLDWDFASVWQMVPGYKYPQLRGMPPAGPTVDIKYTVTFEAGDHGTMDTTPVIVKVGYDETVTIVPSIKENTGYIFAGWESSLGGIYDSEAVGLYRVRADVAFTARYADAEKATVIFDYNGGKDLDGNSFLISSDFPGAAYETPVVTKEGYDFAGWDPSPSLKYGEKGISERLTAKWDAKSYIVSFKAGEHGKLDPSDRQEIVKYGEKITLIPSVEAETGFAFIGWECSETHDFYRNSRLKNLPITAHTTFIALYAEADKSTVVFDYNGGMDNEGRHFVIINGKPGDEYIAPEPTMVGHTLNSINNWLPCLVDCTFAEGADPIYYFAQWEANRYTATFMDDDGSTLLGQVKEIAYGTTVAAGNGGIPDDPIKDGYNFDGWDDGVVTSSDVSKYLVTEHVTFTAKYVEIADAIVVFDYNGGRDDEGKSSKIISGKPGDPYDPPPLPIRDGYTLDTPKSWLTERAEEPGGTFGEAGSSVTYFAQWTPNTYTVTFEAGINGKMTPENPEEPGIYSESVRHGDGVKIVPHIDPNSGYNFPGWSISGDESTYVEETILKMPITGNITFVAKYQLKTSNPPGDTKTETATLTVRAIDNASGAVIPPVITTPILVGERKKIPAPVIPGYDLAEDCQPTKEVTIIAGDNTVDFFYNKKNEPPGPGGSSVSDKIKEVLETQKHISYINGYPDGSVKPDNNITRAEVAIIFWRLLKSPEKNYPVTAAFSDIKGDESYAQAVKYLAQMGIIQGYEDGSFRPSRGITRAEFVAIACRFDDLENSNINPFTDLTGSHWAYAYIISANLKGWISGYPDGEFKPQNNISRAEAVKIINRMLGRGINLADLPIDLPGYTDLKQSHWAYCEIMEATVSHEFERYLDGQFKGWEIWK